MSLVKEPKIGDILFYSDNLNSYFEVVWKEYPFSSGGFLLHLLDEQGQKWYLTDDQMTVGNWRVVESNKQIGGTHYIDLEIQPWEVIKRNKMGFFDGTALKYIMRYRQKNGVEDLKKAVHTLEELIAQLGAESAR